MKWRLAIRLEIGLDVKADPAADATEEVNIEPIDEEEQISEEVSRSISMLLLTISSNVYMRRSPRVKRRTRSVPTKRNSETNSSYDST